MDPTTAAAIGATAGAVLTAATTAYIKFAQHRDATKHAEHTGTIAEYQQLLDGRDEEISRLRSDCSRLRERIDSLNSALTTCYRNYDRAEERILGMQEALEAQGLKFRPWVSPSRPPLPQGDSFGVIDTVQE